MLATAPTPLHDATPLHDPSPAAAVVSKAAARAAAILGLNNATLARVLGVSAASVTRLQAGSYTLAPDGKPYELALLLIRLFRGLDALMAGEAPAMQSWMRTPNLALGGTPQQRIVSVAGLVEAVEYVDSARARL
jgi:hypothetical protein